MFQLDMDFTAPILLTFILLFLLFFNVYLALKTGWLLVLLCSLFGIVFGVMALQIEIPLTPYFQIFYIFFQVVLFLIKILSGATKGT